MQVILLLAMLLAVPQRATTTAPATAPAVSLDDMEPLGEGQVRYIPPIGWKLVQKSEDNLRVRFAAEDESGVIDITVVAQNQPMRPSAKDQMIQIMSKGIREGAEKGGRELVFPPHEEPDERFLLRFRDAQRVEGRIADRVQMYRGMNLLLVHVAATAMVDSVDESQAVHETAAKLLAGMRLAHGAKRTAFRRTQIRVVVPVEYKEARRDDPNGLVATYTDVKNPTSQIIIRSRIVPKDARENEEKRAALLERMIDEERKLPPLTKESVEAEQVGDAGKFLKRIRTTASQGATKLVVETRYLAVGDVLISVRSIAAESDAETVAKKAEKLAEEIKPVREEREPTP